MPEPPLEEEGLRATIAVKRPIRPRGAPGRGGFGSVRPRWWTPLVQALEPEDLPDEPVSERPPAGGTASARASRRERSGILEACALVLVALVLALTLKTYVAEAYEIKGRSMEPTFHNGERVVVLKAFYEIHRHDIVVFASSEDPSKDLVKRVVGLPGETVRVVGGRVFVNGKELEETYIRDFRPGFGDVVYEAKVPPEHYYVLGDNRPDSHDSRYFHAVPAASIRGKVVLRLWPPKALRGF